MEHSALSLLAHLFCTILQSPRIILREFHHSLVYLREQLVLKRDLLLSESWGTSHRICLFIQHLSLKKKSCFNIQVIIWKQRQQELLRRSVCAGGDSLEPTGKDMNQCEEKKEDKGEPLTASRSPRRPIQHTSPLFGLFSSLDFYQDKSGLNPTAGFQLIRNKGRVCFSISKRPSRDVCTCWHARDQLKLNCGNIWEWENKEMSSYILLDTEGKDVKETFLLILCVEICPMTIIHMYNHLGWES